MLNLVVLVTVEFLILSLKLLKILSVKSNNLIVASSEWLEATEKSARALSTPLVNPTNCVEVFDAYSIFSLPTNKVPELGNPSVVSTVITALPPLAVLARSPFKRVSGWLTLLFK